MPEPPADLSFDPAPLDQEARPQAWNPEASGYDPDAPYDEAAWIAAGYDPNATYDWSALGEAVPSEPAGEPPAFDHATEAPLTPLPEEAGPLTDLPAEPSELPPLEFGEYDGPVAPVAFREAVEPPTPPATTGAGGAWLDDGGVGAAPPPPVPAFGDYDAPPPLELGAIGEPLSGEPGEQSLPAEPPLELGEAPPTWLSEEDLDGGFELASDGSFGEPPATPPITPWSASDLAAPTERWESPATLDLSTPFQPVPIPTPRAVGSPLEPDGERSPALEPLPAEPERGPPPAGSRALPLAPFSAAWETDAEPMHLSELDASMEIDVPPDVDVPPEIAAAYDSPPLVFDSPAPVPPPAATEDEAELAGLDPIPAALPPPPPLEPVIVPVPAGGVTTVAGTRRVVIHTLDGQVLRGTLTDANLEAPELELDTGAPGAVTPVMTADVKAIFFMLTPGERPPAPLGKRVRVAFRDGRQVAGFSPDYQEGGAGFFMIPADTRTNTGRIWVYQAAVKQVSVT
jgi:hypothetical protein